MGRFLFSLVEFINSAEHEQIERDILACRLKHPGIVQPAAELVDGILLLR